MGASLAFDQGLQTGRCNSFEEWFQKSYSRSIDRYRWNCPAHTWIAADAAGLFLLIPTTQTLCREWLKRRMELIYAQRNVGNGPIIYG